MDVCKQLLLLLAVGGSALLARSSSSLVKPDGTPGYVAITSQGRANWVVSNTIGRANLIAGVLTAGRSTWANSPKEYGTHWDGFGKRYGIRLAARAMSSSMEAGLGSIWGEDPRYFRTSGQTFKYRLGNVFRMTFVTHNRAGEEMPAYARFISIPGGALLSNAWRPDSQTQMAGAISRISFSLISQLIGNAFSEFKPDLRQRISRRKHLPKSGNLAVSPERKPNIK